MLTRMECRQSNRIQDASHNLALLALCSSQINAEESCIYTGDLVTALLAYLKESISGMVQWHMCKQMGLRQRLRRLKYH